ncbi:MAG: phosphoribosyltransferase [Gemmatimonadota bacterium]|nr:phosphoribosyltransferase [Gemmatimonadota bacterium]
MMYRDRTDAGRQLGARLLGELPWSRDEPPVVLAIPRGGVVVGFEVARLLGASLDVFVARKLGAPGHEELGIGAIAPGGTRVLDEELVRMLGVTPDYIADVSARELDELERRLHRFRGDRPPLALEGRDVVLVDDGLATGVTARVSLLALRHNRPRRLIYAAPVCSPEGAQLLSSECDAVVCLAAPQRFRGVGEWYACFDQTEDEEVVQLLRQNREALKMPHEESGPSAGF